MTARANRLWLARSCNPALISARACSVVLSLAVWSVTAPAATGSPQNLEPRLTAIAQPATSSPELRTRLQGIAELVRASPLVTIPAGRFLMGSTRVDDDPYGLQTQYDDTELPQHKVWLDAYEIDRDEV
ncbi:MAG: hypothetical protein HY444_03220, partial [Nitrospirae bacterium]|nr:hypothetical protein [Nitrospirota bacterium]